jgi:hypothetical protein
MLMSYSIAKHVKENTMANNICVTKRQLAVCINALEREVERITKAYENTEDKEYKEHLDLLVLLDLSVAPSVVCILMK